MTCINRTIKFILSTLIMLIAVTLHHESKAVEFPSIPHGDVFVIDNANIISEFDETTINATSLKLRNEKSIPIVVVSIESLAEYDAADLSINAYARALFDHWGIGRSEYNYGMLLLVSKTDRKARIELGADWAGTANEGSQYIMDKVIIRRFRLDKYSEGIREGALAMEALARGHDLPSPFMPKWVAALIYGLAVLAISLLLLMGVSLIRSGRKGWGWTALAMAGAFLLFMLTHNSRSSGGGFSDGGFSGGGSGGGGGATGSW